MGKSKFSKKKQGRNNKGKVSKSHKDRQHNEKNKAAAAAAPPDAASVSKENENYDSHDLETVSSFKVSLADTYTHPKWIGPDVSGAAYTIKSWNVPMIGAPRSPKRTPPATNRCPSIDLETMAALGVSAVFTHKFPKYDGPPVKNCAGNLENWAALGNPYIH